MFYIIFVNQTNKIMEVYFNSVGQELKINDKVIYDDLSVETTDGLYSPSVKVRRNYMIGRILNFKEMKKYTQAVVEFTVWDRPEIKTINVKYLIKY